MDFYQREPRLEQFNIIYGYGTGFPSASLAEIYTLTKGNWLVSTCVICNEVAFPAGRLAVVAWHMH
jgi:hypothetical protein